MGKITLSYHAMIHNSPTCEKKYGKEDSTCEACGVQTIWRLNVHNTSETLTETILMILMQ
jgi:hypothetical protein